MGDNMIYDHVKVNKKKRADSYLKILSYNVWFDETVALHQRIDEISRIIENEQPNFICLQEVTQNIYRILSSKIWWSNYSIIYIML